jgi:hypothetical protein
MCGNPTRHLEAVKLTIRGPCCLGAESSVFCDWPESQMGAIVPE